MAADDLRERLAAYLDRAEAGADAWGTCTHEWLSLRQLRALLDAHPAPSEPEATVVEECTTPGCDGDWRYSAPGRGHIAGCTYPLVPEPATSNPGSKLEQVGAAGGGLSEEEREALLCRCHYEICPLHNEHADDSVEFQVSDLLAAIERIVREREAAALAAIRDAFWECFDPDFGGVDWRDDAAIQTFARKVAPYVNQSADR